MKLGAKALSDGTTIMFLEGTSPEKVVQCCIYGTIVNDVDGKPKEKLEWKKKIADKVYMEHSGNLTMSDRASISLSLFFYPKQRKFDIDNYTKGIVDATATGLLSDWPSEKQRIKEQGTKYRFNEDDSIFRWIYYERHDADTEEKERVHITVWKHGKRA